MRLEGGTNGDEPFVRENTGKMVSSGGGRGERKKNLCFPSNNWENWPKPAFLRSRDQGASTHIKNSQFEAIRTHFIHHFTFFSRFLPNKLPKSGHFSNKSYICTRIRPRDPSQMKDLLILRRMHLSKAPATFIRPTW